MIKELVLHRAKSIHGWMSDAELLFLADCAMRSKVIFEIGSFVGRSTRALADNTDGVVYAIDPWNADICDGTGVNRIVRTDDVVYNQFYCNLYDHICSGKVVVCRSRWEDFFLGKGADFIFIDGDHKYESVLKDIEKALDYIKPNGILAGHDYSPAWPGVVKAVDEVFNRKLNLYDSIWWINA